MLSLMHSSNTIQCYLSISLLFAMTSVDQRVHALNVAYDMRSLEETGKLEHLEPHKYACKAVDFPSIYSSRESHY